MKSLTKPKTAVTVCIITLALLVCVLSLVCFQAVADTAQPVEADKSSAGNDVSDDSAGKAVEGKIVDNNTGAESKSVSDAKDNSKRKNDKNTDAENVDAKSKAAKVAQNTSTGIKSKAIAVESIDSGWTAIVPNKVEAKGEKLDAVKELRVAEQRVGEMKTLSNDGSSGKVGVWDALPENVTKGDKADSDSAPSQALPQTTAEKPLSPFSTPPGVAPETEPQLPPLTPDVFDNPTPPATLPSLVDDFPSDASDNLREPAPIKSRVIIEDNIDNPKPNEPDGTATNTEKTTAKPIFSTNPNTGIDNAKSNIDATPQQEALTDIQNNNTDEITRRINALAAEKLSLENMLKDAIDKANKELEQGDDAGVARTKNVDEAEGKEEPTATEEPQPQDPETQAGESSAVETEVKEELEPVLPDWDERDAADAPVKQLIDPRRVGDGDAVAKLKLLYEEINNGLKSRNIMGKYERWKEYARTTLRNSAGLNTGSELDGRSRLSWYKKLYNEPIYSVFEAEEFTRQLHDGLSGNHRHIAESMGIIREKLDVPARNDNGITFPKCETPLEAVGEVKRALIAASMHHARAVATLTSAEQTELVGNLVQTFVGTGCVNGHTIPSRTYGRKLLDMMEKVDKAAMHDAAEAFIPLLNLKLLELLDNLPENALPSTLIGGQTFQKLTTSAGDIIIGGRENNAYDLDSPDFRDVVCIIDLGGNDSYRDGTCGLHRPVVLIIDLHGNDRYTATRPGVQGASILGVSVLIDVEGDDRYDAVDVAQGSSIGGIGLLFDFAGNDSYRGLRRVQAHALSGVGMIIDREGDDEYHAAMWAQAFGAPAGFGVLEDVKGNDHYYCGGLYIDSYPEHPGYDGWGQGIGAGIRQVANGGIGVLLEGEGDDVYEVDYFGHGGGYWLGAGFARDFGGNDIRHGTTLTAYNGTARRENKWTRFANGFGCHYSVGYCFDDNGDDVYGGTIMGTGMAWDLSMGYLCDFNGNNKFTATGGMTQGVGAEGSIGILFTYGGNDTFSGRNQAYANGNINYHSVANCGSNFSFLINYGGTDTYGSGAKNNSYVQRGSTGGFLIDRPTSSEAVGELAKLQQLIETRNEEIRVYDEKQAELRKEAAARNRRYVPRTRRPTPISPEQQRVLSGVPDFNNPTSASISATVERTATE